MDLFKRGGDQRNRSSSYTSESGGNKRASFLGGGGGRNTSPFASDPVNTNDASVREEILKKAGEEFKQEALRRRAAEEQVNRLGTELNILKVTHDRISRQLEQGKQDYERLWYSHDDLSKKIKTQREEHQTSLNDVKNDISGKDRLLEAEKRKHYELLDEIEQLKSQQEDLASFKANHESFSKDLQESKDAIAQHQAESGRLAQELGDLQSTHDEVQRTHQSLQQNFQSLVSEKQALASSHAALEEKNSTVSSQIKELEDSIKQHQSHISELQDSIKSSSSSHSSQIETLQKALDLGRERIQTLESNLSKKGAELDDLKVRHASIEENSAQVQEQLQQKHLEVDSLNTSLSKLQTEIKAEQSRNSQLENSHGSFISDKNQLVQQLEHVNGLIASERNAHSETRQIASTHAQNIEGLKAELDRIYNELETEKKQTASLRESSSGEFARLQELANHQKEQLLIAQREHDELAKSFNSSSQEHDKRLNELLQQHEHDLDDHKSKFAGEGERYSGLERKHAATLEELERVKGEHQDLHRTSQSQSEKHQKELDDLKSRFETDTAALKATLPSASEGESDESKQHLARYVEENNNLQEELGKFKNDHSTLLSTHNQLKENHDDLKTRYDELHSKTSDTSHLDNLHRELENLKLDRTKDEANAAELKSKIAVLEEQIPVQTSAFEKERKHYETEIDELHNALQQMQIKVQQLLEEKAETAMDDSPKSPSKGGNDSQLQLKIAALEKENAKLVRKNATLEQMLQEDRYD